VLAVLAGLVTIFVLSLATDQLFHSIGVYPPWGEPMLETDDNLIALTYRAIYAVLGGYIAARLAPRPPVGDARGFGAVGGGHAPLGARPPGALYAIHNVARQQVYRLIFSRVILHRQRLSRVDVENLADVLVSLCPDQFMAPRFGHNARRDGACFRCASWLCNWSRACTHDQISVRSRLAGNVSRHEFGYWPLAGGCQPTANGL
jgi:hypothetical protein